MRNAIFLSFLFVTCAVAPASAIAEGARVIAVVNGVEIRSDERPGQFGTDLSADYESLTSEQKTQLIVALVNRQLVLERARMEGFDRQERIRETVKAMADSYIAEQYLLRVAAGFDIGDEAVDAWYREHYTDLPERFLVSHILLASEDDAHAVREALADGADFGALARERSLDGVSAVEGGRIGWLDAGEMAPSLLESVSRLRQGDVAPRPVRTHSGWHVVRLDDRRDAEAPPLDSVRDEIRQALVARQMSDYMQALRSAATIEIR